VVPLHRRFQPIEAIENGDYVSWASVDDICISPRDSFVLSTSDDLFNQNKLKIFPNPAAESLSVLLEQPLEEDATFRLMGIRGEQLKESRIPKGSTLQHIDLSNLPNGLYILEIQTDSGKIRHSKVAIQR
jgi:Secretion system C-terminal sorting domain